MALLPQELPEAAERRRRRVALRPGPRARRRHLRLPLARAAHAGGLGGRRVGEGRAGRALQRVRRRAGARPHVPAPPRDAAQHARRRAQRDEPDPARAPAGGVLLHALLRDVRPSPAPGDVREFRAAVSGALQRRQGGAAADAGRARWDRSPARPTTRSQSSCRLATSSCSAPTASSKRSTRRARSSARIVIGAVVEQTHDATAKDIVSAIFSAMQLFRGEAEQTDDQTVVVVKVTV